MTIARRTAFLPLLLLPALSLTFGAPAEARSAHPVSRRPAAPRQRLAARQAHQRRLAVVNEALRQRGSRYAWGGASRGAFDCSGLTRYVYLRKRGIALPHSASAQAHRGKVVRSGELKPGDLLFFSTYRPGISHVGIYIGAHKFVHAANSRKGVRVDRLNGYYGKRLRAARRLP